MESDGVIARLIQDVDCAGHCELRSGQCKGAIMTLLIQIPKVFSWITIVVAVCVICAKSLGIQAFLTHWDLQR